MTQVTTSHKVIAEIGRSEYSWDTLMDVRTAEGVIDDNGYVTVEGEVYLPDGQVDTEDSSDYGAVVRPSTYKVFKLQVATAAGAEAAQLRGWLWAALRD